MISGKQFLGQGQLALGAFRQQGAIQPNAAASALYSSEGGTPTAELTPYNRQERFAISRHYDADAKRVDAGGATAPGLADSYTALRDAIPAQAARAAQAVTPTFESNQPQYPDAPTLIQDMDKGSFNVNPTTAEESTVAWDRSTNDQFRGLHDTLGHGGAGTSFSYSGESLAAEAHRSTLPAPAHRALVAEVVGQAAHHEFNQGQFVDQKGLYDVPDWAAKGERMPTPKVQPKQFGGEQLKLL